MTDPTIPPRPAGELIPDDRIAAEVLPGGAPAIVLFVYRYSRPMFGDRVYVVYRERGYGPDSITWPAERLIPLEREVHLEVARAMTKCGLALIDLDTGVGWTNDHDAVTCRACIGGQPS